MAAGGSVEPFWEVYAVHKGNPEVLRMLEEYRIGNLTEEDVAANKETNKSKHDPFANEPQRHPALIKVSRLRKAIATGPFGSCLMCPIHVKVSEKPFNAETPMSLMTDSFYTPNDLFYVRSHLPTPDIPAEEYELEVRRRSDM